MGAVKDAQIRKIVSALIKIIAEDRKAQGLTYEDLADKAGVHRTTIGLLERNERTPMVHIAIQLADALGMKLSEILARAEAIAGGKIPEAARAVKKEVCQSNTFITKLS